MILKEIDIYDNLESYRNGKGYSQEKMAEIMGLSNKQAYSNMVKNKTMKLSYFINLVNRTDVDPDKILGMNPNNLDKNILQEPEVDIYNCPECIQKQKKITELQEKNSELYEKYSACLEKLLGKKGNDVANSA